MSAQTTITLNDGNAIPQLGIGVWQVPNAIATSIVAAAISAGYRSIDTAAAYENEEGVGAAIAQSLVARSELFITTKLWNARHGFDDALRAFDESMTLLGLDYLDLYLIHWPTPGQNRYLEAWRALIELQRQGRIKSIGVSNFNAPHLRHIIDATGVAPSVNQIELHPRFQQAALRQFHTEIGIATQAWSPLGQGQVLQNPIIQAIAAKHAKTTAQIILRWHLQNDIIAIPKSVTPARILENFAVFDFNLDSDDLQKIAKLDSVDGRIGPDPDTANFLRWK